MTPLPHEHELARWLEAEACGRRAAADRLFAGIAASHWARAEPPRGFARRVSAALEARPRPVWWESWWVRAALLASLGAVGAALAVAPSSAMASLGVSAVVRMSQGLSWILACSQFAVDGAWALWSAGARLSSWVEVVLSAPISQLLIALNLAMAAAASLALRRLLRAEEMPS
ncbi:MAG: hypothetical protein AB1806_00615 [Acidobacteriota bacterium]